MFCTVNVATQVVFGDVITLPVPQSVSRFTSNDGALLTVLAGGCRKPVPVALWLTSRQIMRAPAVDG